MPSTSEARHRPGRPRRDARELRTFGACLRFFFRKAGVWVIVTCWLVAVAARVAVGGWAWTDLLVVAVIVALQPFTEWLIHVFILHHRPRKVGPVNVDFHAAAKHRGHHRDPQDIDTAFVPLGDLIGLIVVAAAIAWLLTPGVQLWLTAVVVELTLLGWYEWVHFIAHVAWKPRGIYFNRQRRLHRWHHFRNEHYWLGVTVHLGDTVLGTMKARDAVPMSPTARDLFGIAADELTAT